MTKIAKWATLALGALAASIIIAVYGQSAVQTIAGLAVAQSGTQWNNVKDLAFGDNMTNGVLAAGVVVYDGTNFDRVRGDTTNGLDVDVTRVSGTVTVAGAITPTDNVSPTDAVDAYAFQGLFDGTNWDRQRSFATNVDGVAAQAVTTSGIAGSVVYEFEFNGTTFDRVRNSFTQSTASITGNGAGTTVTMTTTPMSKYTMIIDRTAGSTNPVEVDLECSIDSTDFVQIATITDLTNEPVLTSVDGVPCPYMRYNVVTVGAGNTLQVHLFATR